MAHAHHAPDHAHRHNREAAPAAVGGIQADYLGALARRLRRLRGVLRTTVGYANDALSLATRANVAGDISPRESFPFDNRAGKQLAFRQQLQRWLDAGVLEPVGDDVVAAGEHYTARFVDRAYEAGLEWADGQLAAAGGEPPTDAIASAFSMPIHEQQLRDLYTRNFRGLDRITADIDRSLSRILTRGLIDGIHPRRMADRMTAEVADIQRTRARALARTETLFSHNASAARRYQQAGVTQVDILPADPCPVCEALVDQNPWPIAEAASLVPARTHPNCQCTIVPRV